MITFKNFRRRTATRAKSVWREPRTHTPSSSRLPPFRVGYAGRHPTSPALVRPGPCSRPRPHARGFRPRGIRGIRGAPSSTPPARREVLATAATWSRRWSGRSGDSLPLTLGSSAWIRKPGNSTWSCPWIVPNGYRRQRQYSPAAIGLHWRRLPCREARGRARGLGPPRSRCSPLLPSWWTGSAPWSSRGALGSSPRSRRRHLSPVRTERVAGAARNPERAPPILSSAVWRPEGFQSQGGLPGLSCSGPPGRTWSGGGETPCRTSSARREFPDLPSARRCPRHPADLPGADLLSAGRARSKGRGRPAQRDPVGHGGRMPVVSSGLGPPCCRGGSRGSGPGDRPRRVAGSLRGSLRPVSGEGHGERGRRQAESELTWYALAARYLIDTCRPCPCPLILYTSPTPSASRAVARRGITSFSDGLMGITTGRSQGMTKTTCRSGVSSGTGGCRRTRRADRRHDPQNRQDLLRRGGRSPSELRTFD